MTQRAIFFLREYLLIIFVLRSLFRYALFPSLLALEKQQQLFSQLRDSYLVCKEAVRLPLAFLIWIWCVMHAKFSQDEVKSLLLCLFFSQSLLSSLSGVDSKQL